MIHSPPSEKLIAFTNWIWKNSEGFYFLFFGGGGGGEGGRRSKRGHFFFYWLLQERLGFWVLFSYQGWDAEPEIELKLACLCGFIFFSSLHGASWHQSFVLKS